MKKNLLLFCFLMAVATQAHCARKFTIFLHPDSSANVVCFLPEQSSGKAIVGVPGGGYSVLSNTHEGTMWADWLNQRGIAYFVVNYRLPNGNRTLPISDVQQTVRMVRDSASAWKLNPHDVGIMGFSAGGHLASVVSTHSQLACRPDFSILFYPVISMDERVSHVWSCRNFLGEDQKNPEMVSLFSTNNAVRRHLTPPAVIITASDDRLVPPVTNAVAYYTAMRNAGNECAMFVYPTGDHGFGFGPWFKYHDQMLTDLGNWLDARQVPQPHAIRVACIGNSITDGHGIDMAPASGYPALLQRALGKDYWVKNFGVSGRTLLRQGDMPYMQEQAWQDAKDFDPDIVIIKLGTNDSKPQNWKYASDFKKDLRQMITELHPEHARIFICTPIPAIKPSWEINDSVIAAGIIPIQREVARDYGFKVIDLYSLFGRDSSLFQDDGIHPNDKGVRRLAEIIADAIK